MDLAEKVTWVANENCNAGYDIQSFFEDGSYKYIEVKVQLLEIYTFI